MPPSPREAPSTVQACSVPSRVRRTARSPPGARSSDIVSPDAAGTGAYEDLHANGKISGTVQGSPPAEIFVLTYTGTATDN